MRPTVTQLDVFILVGALIMVLMLSAIVGLVGAKLFDWFTRERKPPVS